MKQTVARIILATFGISVLVSAGYILADNVQQKFNTPDILILNAGIVVLGVLLLMGAIFLFAWAASNA